MRRHLFIALIYVATAIAIFAVGETLLRMPTCERCGSAMRFLQEGTMEYECPACGSQIDLSQFANR